MKSSLKLTTAFVAALLSAPLALGAVSAAQAAPEHFTFGSVEYLPYATRIPAAKAFVAEQLPMGTSAQAAIERLRTADAYCPDQPAANGQIKCHFSMMVRPTMGTMGEVTWAVNLSQDGQGRLAAVTVDRTRTGLGDD
jgi:hypothetical protein